MQVISEIRVVYVFVCGANQWYLLVPTLVSFAVKEGGKQLNVWAANKAEIRDMFAVSLETL